MSAESLITASIDHRIREKVYLKQEGAKARLALRLAAERYGFSEDELLEIASYQDDELVDEMQKLQAEAHEEANRVVGITRPHPRQAPRRPRSPESIEFAERLETSIENLRWLNHSRTVQVVEMIEQLFAAHEADMKELEQNCLNPESDPTSET